MIAPITRASVSGLRADEPKSPPPPPPAAMSTSVSVTEVVAPPKAPSVPAARRARLRSRDAASRAGGVGGDLNALALSVLLQCRPSLTLRDHVLKDELGAKVRRGEDERVGEIDNSALGVGQATVVEDLRDSEVGQLSERPSSPSPHSHPMTRLEKDREHCAVGFFNLVEQHDRKGTAADSCRGRGNNGTAWVCDASNLNISEPPTQADTPPTFSQHASCIVAHVARRGANETCHGVLLHQLAACTGRVCGTDTLSALYARCAPLTVDANDVVLVVEELGCERLA